MVVSIGIVRYPPNHALLMSIYTIFPTFPYKVKERNVQSAFNYYRSDVSLRFINVVSH